jgi:hypothetical protein
VYMFFKQKSGKKKGSHGCAFKNGLNNILSYYMPHNTTIKTFDKKISNVNTRT